MQNYSSPVARCNCDRIRQNLFVALQVCVRTLTTSYLRVVKQACPILIFVRLCLPLFTQEVKIVQLLSNQTIRLVVSIERAN